MAAVVDALVVVLILALICGSCAGWWLLLDWVYRKVKPSLERWIWRRLGGEGDPPDRGII